MSDQPSEVEKQQEQEENTIFEQAFNAIDNTEDLVEAKDIVADLVGKLESLYDGNSMLIGDAKIPRFMLYKTILGVKSVVEQWINCKNGCKADSAPAVLAQVWTILESFAKDKTIPENIYDIVAENHALKEQLKEMRKEK
jgi:hypothetical protein